MSESIIAALSTVFVVTSWAFLTALAAAVPCAVVILLIVFRRVTWTRFEAAWLIPYILDGIRTRPDVKIAPFMARYLESARARGLVDEVRP
ncbi:MAG: hypothetical protein HQL35_14015 [Alphaproteobacteria bacterium]|nr:hypothetical protein [Alphaproteobacteria bacterium]